MQKSRQVPSPDGFFNYFKGGTPAGDGSETISSSRLFSSA
jgi:hypothetical protein